MRRSAAWFAMVAGTTVLFTPLAAAAAVGGEPAAVEVRPYLQDAVISAGGPSVVRYVYLFAARHIEELVPLSIELDLADLAGVADIRPDAGCRQSGTIRVCEFDPLRLSAGGSPSIGLELLPLPSATAGQRGTLVVTAIVNHVPSSYT